MSEKYIYGVKLLVDDLEQAAGWLCSNLFFAREADGEAFVLKNGRFRILLENGKETAAGEDPDAMYLGIRHIALETSDVNRAIEYCRTKGLRLQLNDQGGARHNGKVYGTGMDYFNILSGLGFTVEVSQRLHCKGEPDGAIIHGLEHVGIQVPDAGEAIKFYESLGFHKEFEPVLNRCGEHRIICCMVSAGQTAIEIYEFADVENTQRQEQAAFDTLVLAGGGTSGDIVRHLRGTAGEQIEIRV